MYCPSCGQQQAPGEVRFCPRCGFPQYGVMALLNAQGQWPGADAPPSISPRKRGVKQGAMMLFLGIVLTPLLGVLTQTEEVAGVTAIIFILGGFLRMLFAAIFEEGKNPVPVMNNVLPAYAPPHSQHTFAHTPTPQAALPPPTPQAGIPTNLWRAQHSTQEIVPAPPSPPSHSVTEHTTRMLAREKE